MQMYQAGSFMITTWLPVVTKKKTVSVIISTNIDSSGRGKDSVRKDQSRDEILLRSVKMIVSRMDDSASLSQHLGSNLNLRKDTVVFMKGDYAPDG